MQIFLYLIIFIIGTFFGSFFTLAVYRIPKKEDILIKHSYCPNCNNKLGLFDLFPVFSYVFLGGKCRYCKNKIRPRYLILELLSGVTFLILAISIKFNVFNINSILKLVFLLVYVSILFIIAGIDKENIKIEKSVLIFGYIIEILYMIYQYTLNNFNVYQYVIYTIGFIILLFISNINCKKKYINKYFMQNLFLLVYILIGGGLPIFIYTIFLTLITFIIYKINYKLKFTQIPIGFYLCLYNIIIVILLNISVNYII